VQRVLCGALQRVLHVLQRRAVLYGTPLHRHKPTIAVYNYLQRCNGAGAACASTARKARTKACVCCAAGAYRCAWCAYSTVQGTPCLVCLYFAIQRRVQVQHAVLRVQRSFIYGAVLRVLCGAAYRAGACVLCGAACVLHTVLLCLCYGVIGTKNTAQCGALQ